MLAEMMFANSANETSPLLPVPSDKEDQASSTQALQASCILNGFFEGFWFLKATIANLDDEKAVSFHTASTRAS